MKPLFPALLATTLFLPQAGHALQLCDELWLTRNYLFHKAGQCFNSTLAQQLFGNANCSTSAARLSGADTEAVTYMRGLEAELGCRVNTNANPSADMRARVNELSRLIDIPTPDEFGFACWGYSGPSGTLHAGASAGSPVIGRFDPGQSLISEYWGKDGWIYYVINSGPLTPAITKGWARVTLDGSVCAQMAG